jgi:hypothetical protein
MSRLRVRHRPTRALLSEFIPYELPIGFSNSGLYAFLLKEGAHFVKESLVLKGNSSDLRALLTILLGPKVQPMPYEERGHSWLQVSMKQLERKTVPYRFRIRHGATDFRELAIPHPRGQLAFVAFYDNYKSLITHFGKTSPFSIRKPVEEVRFTIVRDDLFDHRVDPNESPVETVGHETDRLRSFFRYESFANMHGFYESSQYQDAEKKFAYLLRLDVARCFDSIYTHSIEWAIYGRDNVKSNRKAYEGTFPSRFDSLISALNEDETNGILIGPEVSRIFAEIIFQRIDRDICDALEAVGIVHNVDYVGFRYVDDYFFFYNAVENKDIVQRAVGHALRAYKLHIQDAKILCVETPHLTPLSLAKVAVRQSVARSLNASLVEPAEPLVNGVEASQCVDVTSNSLEVISAYKTALAETGVLPRELANYALVQIEEALESALLVCMSLHANTLLSAEKAKHDASTTRLLAAAVESAYFVYSGSGLASAGIKVARISALSLKAAKELRHSRDREEFIKQLIYSEVCLQLIRHPMSSNATIEGLYLLDVLSELGDGYLLPIQQLAAFLDCDTDAAGVVKLPSWNHAASALTILRYVKYEPRYSGLRRELEGWVVARVDALLQEQDDHAERAILALDLLNSPYIGEKAKREILRMHNVSSSPAALKRLTEISGSWFTNWSRVDLHRDLLEKRSQHVY